MVAMLLTYVLVPRLIDELHSIRVTGVRFLELRNEQVYARHERRAGYRAVIDLLVAVARLTREVKEIRRGFSIQGAIDLADLFTTPFDGFNDNE